ncbi:hypothetical protein PHLGIDRAFT_16682 [Phlebiopsis gigantea 11061_1 CR5-6]|uniref:N-acetyltransferase domain-containing protein n=1 Tax=Phlebiopsis gigantea (strain 11061_1 CR5-6) TaxID=745531 RepID=A0A0C3S354_PHLG1|nr:hypothetical protein PHLGIDRAFT_16682 [Phlebiopsis gigantea 11061_1 CR5-6]
MEPKPQASTELPSYPPFDKGDIVIRSSDKVDLVMYKSDLIRASPVFETMFSLPQPSPVSPVGNYLLIQFSETGEVLKSLFTPCLPWQPVIHAFANFEHALQVIAAAKKYEMDWLVTMVRQSPAIQEAAQRDPVAAYFKAHHFGFVEEITLAARLCLRLPLMDILNAEIDSYAFEDIGFKPSSYQRLLRYRINCFEAVRTFIESKAIFSDYSTHGSLNDIQLEDTWMIEAYCQRWWTSYKPGIIAQLENNTVMGIDGFGLMTSFLDDAKRTEVSNLPPLGRLAKQILHFASWMTDEINDLISPLDRERSNARRNAHFRSVAQSLEMAPDSVHKSSSTATTNDLHQLLQAPPPARAARRRRALRPEPYDINWVFPLHTESLATARVTLVPFVPAALAGVLGLFGCSAANLSAEIAYVAVLPAFQRTHVASNAVGLLMRYCLELPGTAPPGLGLRRVQWCAHTKNVRSARLAERMGFRREGVHRWMWVLPKELARDGDVVTGEGRAADVPGRHTFVLSVCWDDWEDGVREIAQGNIDREA